MKSNISHNTQYRRTLVEVLSGRKDILFAFLYGSFAAGIEHDMSDLDVAVYCDRNLNLLEQGWLTSRLEVSTARNVDVVLLNGLYRRDPKLAYDIVFAGELLFSRDDVRVADYRRMALHYFVDTEQLRREVFDGLMQRLGDGSFGRFS